MLRLITLPLHTECPTSNKILRSEMDNEGKQRWMIDETGQLQPVAIPQ
jgi:hypothetical protein